MLQKALSVFASEVCEPAKGAGSFFNLPHWYQYLKGEKDPLSGKCIPMVKNLNDIWAIALAIVDMLLVVAGFIAVIFVIYGGFQYITSQGEPDKTAAAKNTIVNAIVGLVIVMLAIGVVSYIGGNF